MRFKVIWGLTSAFMLSALMGCGGSSIDGSIADSNRTNIQRLSNLYVRYQTQHRWQGPKDEEEFRQYISGIAAPTLDRMGINPGTTDGLFVSDRDNAPFTIRWGVRGSARGSHDAVVFESLGEEGVRQVGFTSMQVEDVTDEARYQGLLNGSIREPLPAAKSPARR